MEDYFALNTRHTTELREVQARHAAERTAWYTENARRKAAEKEARQAERQAARAAKALERVNKQRAKNQSPTAETTPLDQLRADLAPIFREIEDRPRPPMTRYQATADDLDRMLALGRAHGIDAETVRRQIVLRAIDLPS